MKKTLLVVRIDTFESIYMRRLSYFVLIAMLLMTSSCKPVKEYQKAYLNDDEMTLGERQVSVYAADFHSYREGAVGGTIGNSGSGCGCN